MTNLNQWWLKAETPVEWKHSFVSWAKNIDTASWTFSSHSQIGIKITIKRMDQVMYSLVINTKYFWQLHNMNYKLVHKSHLHECNNLRNSQKKHKYCFYSIRILCFFFNWIVHWVIFLYVNSIRGVITYHSSLYKIWRIWIINQVCHLY